MTSSEGFLIFSGVLVTVSVVVTFVIASDLWLFVCDIPMYCHVRYSLSKYLSVAMITVGITIATLASASSVVWFLLSHFTVHFTWRAVFLGGFVSNWDLPKWVICWHQSMPSPWNCYGNVSLSTFLRINIVITEILIWSSFCRWTCVWLTCSEIIIGLRVLLARCTCWHPTNSIATLERLKLVTLSEKNSQLA